MDCGFVPNELQKALFKEVMDSPMLGYAESRSQDQLNRRVCDWLNEIEQTIRQLAGVARAGLREQALGKDCILIAIMASVERLPDEVGDWFHKRRCLFELIGPVQ